MDNSKELVIITGVSGAGKSSAMAFMEDAGYYCIDNMPPELMSTFVGLLANNSEYYPKVAMVVDVRSGHVFEKIISSIDNVEQYDIQLRLFILILTIQRRSSVISLLAENTPLQINSTAIFKMHLIMRGKFLHR